MSIISSCAKKDTNKEPSTTPRVGSTTTEERNKTNEGQPASRELLYRAAVSSNLQNEASVRQLIDDYRKTVYGNLYLEHYLSSKIKVTMDEIRDRYLSNRPTYRRRTDEVRLIQFLTQNEGSANEVKFTLLQYDAGLRISLLKEHRVSPVTVSPGDMPEELDLLLFGSSRPRGILGPEKTQYGYHVLEVLEFFPQGSYRGLDEVYDEISQNIYRSKRANLYSLLLDSLRNVYLPNADVGGAQKPR